MGGGFSVKLPHRSAHALKRGLRICSGGRIIVEQVDERSAVQVFDDELAAFVIQIPYGRYRESSFPGANQQACFADHSTDAEAMVEVRVSPRARTTLLADGRFTKPFSFPNLGFCTEVKALGRLEDHGSLTKPLFLNIHAHPFLEKGSLLGLHETHDGKPPYVLGQFHGHHLVR